MTCLVPLVQDKRKKTAQSWLWSTTFYKVQQVWEVITEMHQNNERWKKKSWAVTVHKVARLEEVYPFLMMMMTAPSSRTRTTSPPAQTARISPMSSECWVLSRTLRWSLHDAGETEFLQNSVKNKTTTQTQQTWGGLLKHTFGPGRLHLTWSGLGSELCIWSVFRLPVSNQSFWTTMWLKIIVSHWPEKQRN